MIALSAVNIGVLRQMSRQDKEQLLAVLQRKLAIQAELTELEREFNKLLFPVADIRGATIH